MAKYVEVEKLVYVMYVYVGIKNEDEELEDIFDRPEEHTAETREELETLWNELIEENNGIYGYYGNEPAYYTGHIISDEPEKRIFYEPVKTR